MNIILTENEIVALVKDYILKTHAVLLDVSIADDVVLHFEDHCNDSVNGLTVEIWKKVEPHDKS